MKIISNILLIVTLIGCQSVHFTEYRFWNSVISISSDISIVSYIDTTMKKLGQNKIEYGAPYTVFLAVNVFDKDVALPICIKDLTLHTLSGHVVNSYSEMCFYDLDSDQELAWSRKVVSLQPKQIYTGDLNHEDHFLKFNIFADGILKTHTLKLKFETVTHEGNPIFDGIMGI